MRGPCRVSSCPARNTLSSIGVGRVSLASAPEPRIVAWHEFVVYSAVALTCFGVGWPRRRAPGPGSAPGEGIAIILNSGEASISLLDVAHGTEIRRVPVLREPHHVVLAPGGRELLVGDSGGNEMLFLDPVTGRDQAADGGGRSVSAGVQPQWQVAGGDRAGAQPGGRLRRGVHGSWCIDFPIGTMPSHLAYSPDSNVVYVTLQGTNRVAAFDLSHMTVLWNAEVGAAPAGIHLARRASCLWPTWAATILRWWTRRDGPWCCAGCGRGAGRIRSSRRRTARRCG